MSHQSPLKNAVITWQTDHAGNTTPISTAFDDVYFSKAGGLDETHYVFLQGNGLPTRFGNLTDHQSFVIMETGFGTGLNFLATCLLWSKTAPPTARLYFVSTEKYPLSASDLQKALHIWQDHTELKEQIDKLLTQYPMALSGCHRLHFGAITLDLWLGDAYESFCQMHTKTGLVDAWFLDGFAPSKNSELWSPQIFEQIARLSKPNATLATFTSAGFVKRALQSIGMTVVKIKGFGRKREMITAHFNQPATHMPAPRTATVIGAGISGLFSAYALARRGVSVTLIDKTAPIAGASGNPKALFAPKLSLPDGAAHHLPTVGFLYAHRSYKALNERSNTTIFEQTGVVDFLLPTQKSYDKLAKLVNSYPDELIYQFNHELNSDNDDFNQHTINTFIQKAGLIDTQRLADVVLSHPLIDFKKFNVVSIDTHHQKTIIKDEQQTLTSDIAVICAGFESHLLNGQLFNPRKIRGQVSFLPITNKDDTIKTALATPIKYDGYCASFNDTLLMGASFVRNCTDTDVKADEHAFNLHKFSQALPTLAQKLNINPADLQGRASIRAQTPDYHPLVGKVEGQIYTIYGMGSKGFSFAPLCGEILADMVCHTPICVSQTLLDKLSPARPRLQNPIDQTC